jgi:hypothetical protein
MLKPTFACLTLLAVVATAQPALADGALFATLGESVPFAGSARQIGGTALINVGVGLDLNNLKPLPLRNSVLFDYATGSANGGSITNWGVGFGTRLSTPTYIGAAAFLYNVNVNQGSVIGSHSATSFGSNIYVGQRFISVPGGLSVGAQITYRQLPVVNGIDSSGISFAVRGSL